MAERPRTKREKLLLFELVGVINQACQYPKWNGKGRCRVDHMYLSTYEDAFIMLEDYGVIKKDRKGYWLDWRVVK